MSALKAHVEKRDERTARLHCRRPELNTCERASRGKNEQCVHQAVDMGVFREVLPASIAEHAAPPVSEPSRVRRLELSSRATLGG